MDALGFLFGWGVFFGVFCGFGCCGFVWVFGFVCVYDFSLFLFFFFFCLPLLFSVFLFRFNAWLLPCVQVQQAGRDALDKIGSVIKNPEIQKMLPFLLSALNDPVKHTQVRVDGFRSSLFLNSRIFYF
jgi:hypothetical protein